jgi:hypothetical protein
MRLLRRETIIRLTHIGTSGRTVGRLGVLQATTGGTLEVKSSRSGLMAHWAPYVCVRVIGQ